MKRIGRRTLLRGAGGVALGLPLLETMGHPRLASAASAPGYTAAGHPKRFLAIYTPNGTIQQNWTPTGGETDFQFSRILKPLEPYRSKLLLIDGVDQLPAKIGGTPGDGHQKAMQGFLTGQVIAPGTIQGNGSIPAGYADGISVDQRIANVIGTETKLKSLELAVQPQTGETNWNRMSLLGSNRPLPTELNPFKVYERLFKDAGVSPAATDQSIARRKTVLDAVAENIRQLQRKLGSADRAKLDQHLQVITEMEGRLGLRTAGALPVCAAPVLGNTTLDATKQENFPVVGRLQTDLLVMALACDLTRVGSILWNREVGDIVHKWADPTIKRGHHDMSHDGDTNTDTLEKLTKINIWYAEQFAYLLKSLNDIPEGDGTMLDNTVVFWGNGLSKGNDHSRANQHYVVAGGAGYFRMGRCLKFNYADTVPHNQLLLSFINAMGIEDTTFGNPEWCPGPLSGMT